MPDWRPVLLARLAGLRLTPAREAEIVEELSLHLEDRYRELIRGGTHPREAERVALGELREHDLLRQRMDVLRQAHAADPITPGAPRQRVTADLWQDLKYAARMLARQRGFTAAATLTLALGIGANTAIFSLVDATLLQRLPVSESSRLVYVGNRGVSGTFSYPEYVDVRDQTDVFESFAAWGGIAVSLNAEETTLVVREGMMLVAIGVVIGLAGAFAGAGSLRQFLHGISAFDAVTFVAVPAILSVVALAACLIPARRAMRVSPTEALRYN